MPHATVIPIERLELRFAPQAWPFADERRAEIDRYFAALKADKPEVWNGRVLVLHEFAIGDGVLRGRFLETDFASLLAWRDWGFPDAGVRNCFAMAALKGTDDGFVLGVMGSHTANAGKVYFIGGTPDPDDVVGDTVDFEGSVLRELAEETGLVPGEVESERGWYVIPDAGRIAVVKVLRARVPAAALRDRILGFLSREQRPELSAPHVVHGPGDFDPMMPGFVTQFFRHVWQLGE